ncbi:MAG: hypothetical protein ACTHL8_16065 [Burkholderiaceae bacterium]
MQVPDDLDPNEPRDALDALLRAHAPAALADDGFTERTMQAVARAAPPRRSYAPPRPSPQQIARALVREERRYAAQARLWRWGAAGIVVGAAMFGAVIAGSPAGDLALAGQGTSWAPMWAMACAAALWAAWRQVRSD